jgi:myo-inositol-1(or 4)-monophosphatase
VKDDTGYGKSVVTEYDVESERRVFEFISERYPADSFLGEEHGNVRRDPGRYWLLDPIDGTTNFTQGVAYWGPTLAICDRKGPLEGWIYFPLLDELFHARRGEGATLNGHPIHASRVTEYSKLCSVATTSSCHRLYQLTVPAKHRILGSLVVNMAYLATGTFAACFCQTHVWDIAAGLVIATEAGAVVDCRPGWDTLDLSAMEVETAPSLTIFARANPRLPPLERFMLPLKSDKKPC